MQPIKAIRSRTVVLPAANIDTDQIIPARFLTTTTKEGLGRQLFADWRYNADGSERPDFILNLPQAAGCRVLVAGRNIGCGSSREHAPWALLDYGFQAVISTEIADIFRNNAVGNGLLPIALPEAAVESILSRAEQDESYWLEVDVEICQVRDNFSLTESFAIDEASRRRLLEGKDEIDLILNHESDIAAYERRRPAELA